MRRSAALLAGLALSLGALSACSDDAPTPSGEGSSEPGVVDVTFEGDSVTPNGERVEIGVGEEVTLHVTADAPGEIHVHSNPEQELEYAEGETDLTFTIEEPGVVDVESHDLEVVIVQLEVS